MISSKEEEEEVKGCFMEIDNNLISTTSLYELLSEPYDMYQSDFGLEVDDQFDLFLEIPSLGQDLS